MPEKRRMAPEMKRRLNRIGVIALLIVGCAAFASGQVGLKVCPDPSAPCKSASRAFEPYELSFQLPRKLKPNFEYKSEEFWAIVLKAHEADLDTECDKGEYSSKLERERKQVQRKFPDRKVFADTQCPDMGALTYVINGRANSQTFLAIFAGATKTDADELLPKLKSEYPHSVVRRMRVTYSELVQ
jgi:hypothetical protein